MINHGLTQRPHGDSDGDGCTWAHASAPFINLSYAHALASPCVSLFVCLLHTCRQSFFEAVAWPFSAFLCFSFVDRLMGEPFVAPGEWSGVEWRSCCCWLLMPIGAIRRHRLAADSRNRPAGWFGGWFVRCDCDRRRRSIDTVTAAAPSHDLNRHMHARISTSYNEQMVCDTHHNSRLTVVSLSLSLRFFSLLPTASPRTPFVLSIRPSVWHRSGAPLALPHICNSTRSIDVDLPPRPASTARAAPEHRAVPSPPSPPPSLSAMIKLKGDGESMAQRVMNKALGGKNSNTAPLVGTCGRQCTHSVRSRIAFYSAASFVI